MARHRLRRLRLRRQPVGCRLDRRHRVRLLDGRTARQRFATGALVALAWYLPSTLWMVKFSPAGWPLGVALWFPLVVGATAALCPPQAIALALPATIVISEWVPRHAPFGGIGRHTGARCCPSPRMERLVGGHGRRRLSTPTTPSPPGDRAGTVGAIVAPSGKHVVSSPPPRSKAVA
jgi:hypothetical protein